MKREVTSTCDTTLYTTGSGWIVVVVVVTKLGLAGTVVTSNSVVYDIATSTPEVSVYVDQDVDVETSEIVVVRLTVCVM